MMNLNQVGNRLLGDFIYVVDECTGTADRVVLGIKDKLDLCDILGRLKESEILKQMKYDITVKLNMNTLSKITVNRK